MAATDTIIVDFPALETAVTQFKESEKIITGIIDELKTNANTLSNVWQADASETYRTKVEQFGNNVSAAREKLEINVQDLQKRIDDYKQTVAKTNSIASNLNEFNMQ